MRRGLVAVGLGAAICVVAPVVQAQPEAAVGEAPTVDDPGAQAVQRGHAGLEAFGAGKWQAALEHFEAAEALSHSPVFQLYIARSLRNLGRLLDARDRFEVAVEESLSDDAPTAWRQAQINGRAELAALNERIPVLSILVVSPQGEPSAKEQWTATLNGKPIAVKGPIAVDPGTYEIEITHKTLGARSQTAKVREADGTVTVDFDFSTDDSKPRSVGPVAPSEPSADGPLWPGATLLVGGGLGLGVGAVAGIIALSKAGDLKDACGEDQHCPSELASDGDSVETAALVSTIGFIIGGVLATAGVTVLVLRPGGGTSSSVERDERRALTIKLGAAGASFHGWF